MKRIVYLTIVMVAVLGMTVAQSSDQISKLQLAHKKAMQYYGHIFMQKGTFSAAVVGKDLVSIARGDTEMSFYTEIGKKKIYTHLQMEVGDRASEVVFVFDNRLTINDNTYTMKYKLKYTFGGKTVGYIIVTKDKLRWNWVKCWACVKCAGDNIIKLYQAYQECSLDWQCWITKYPVLISLYKCVKDNCIACFTE